MRRREFRWNFRTDGVQSSLIMAKAKRKEGPVTVVGPDKGDFIAPPEVADANERADALPEQ
jgi:hypothetical protein